MSFGNFFQKNSALRGKLTKNWGEKIWTPKEIAKGILKVELSYPVKMSDHD